MFSRFFSLIAGRGCGSCGSTSSRRQRRTARRIAIAAGQAIDALESRVLLSTLYVDASAPGPTYDGSSWTTAYKDLQLALSASASGDEIRIADGTYKPTSTTSRTISFALRNGVAIRGGYAGHGASDPDARDIALYPTILSGNIGISGSKTDNSYHVITANGVGASTVLDGVTVTEGYANGSSSNQDYGAGLYATGASPTLINCTFTINSASSSGGGIYNSSSSPTLTNCSFAGNSASSNASYGGGMYNSSSSPVLNNCTFSGNSASNGGGIYSISSSAPKLTNCTFKGNSAAWGGGIFNSSSSPKLKNCIFSCNSATTGGGMYNYSSAPTLTNCTFGGNSASYGGGVYNNTSPSPTLTNCVIWGNTGGAVYNGSTSTPIITYSDIQGGYTGTGNIDADPLFVRSPWTGPDGLFGTADDDPGDLRLRPGSPALDIGFNAAVVGLSTDLAGNARVQDGTVDLGAYEGPVTAPAPKTLYVDAAAAGVKTGISWTNAFTSVQSALLAASDGDTIRIASGTYKPTSTTDRTLGFALRNTVAIYGGYAGYGGPDPDARDIVAYPTVFSGDIGAAGNSTDNSHHVLTATGVSPLTVLDGITVTRGNASGTGSNQSRGGGVYIIGGAVRLINCTISGNSAATGGGMYNHSSSPTLTNCTLSGNSANSGGGMYNSSSSSTLVNCTLVSNSAAGGTGTGGGMHNESSSPALTNCELTSNSASQSGGGIYSEGGTPTISSCTFASNTAGSGGGICNSGSSPTITNCVFSRNSAGGGGAVSTSNSSPRLSNCIFEGNSATLRSGGAIESSNSSIATLADCTFTRNWATGAGGAVYASSSASNAYSITIARCAFRGNSASGGGAVGVSNYSCSLDNCAFSGNWATGPGGAVNLYSLSSPSAVRNCTFAGNSASLGGGMYNYRLALIVSNCIFWGNSAIDSPQVFGVAPTYSDVEGGIAGIGNVNVDPHFVRSPSPGPDRIWGGSDDDYGDLAIGACSPVVDAGSNAVVPTGTTTDLMGNSRFLDVPTTSDAGTGASPVVDMGAYEAVPALAADAGGAYIVLEGQPSITLNGRGASAVPGSLQYDWDFSGNGQFSDASGPTPTLSTAQYAGGAVLRVALRVTDASGEASVSTATVRIAPLVVHVDGRAQGGVEDGTSWVDAFTSLQAALAVTIPGQTIRVATGVYKPTATTRRDVSFQLVNQVAVYGGYAGLGSPDSNVRDTLAYPTVLSGDIGTAGDRTDNSYAVLRAAVEINATATLDGFTISDGNADATSEPFSSGGGICMSNGAGPTIANCVFRQNVARSRGGAVYNGLPTIIGCTFVDNTAYSGGAVSVRSGTFRDCTFIGNCASGPGGAIYCDSATPTMINCSVIANRASYGGAIYIHSVYGTPTLINCTLTANTATGGAAIYTYQHIPAVRNCIIWGNLPSGTQFYYSSGTPKAYFSNVELAGGVLPGNGNINADPLFLRNPSPGSDNLWGTADDDYGDLRLQPASPCVDRGDNSAPDLATITTDLAGEPRCVDIAFIPDAGIGTVPIIDLGAYETQSWCPLWLERSGSAIWDAGTQTLDIGESALVVAADESNRAERLAAIRQFIASGRGGGAGIVCSAAGEDRAVIAALDGEGSILICLARIGDVTLDDQLDGDDYFAMDRAFLASAGTFQPAADLNVDGTIDGRDYLMLDLRFLRSATAAIEPSAPLLPVAQAAQQPPAAPFSTQTIANELLLEEDSVLLTAR